MIIVEENTAATIKMFIRDFSEPIYYLEVISEGNRKQESFTDITSGSTYDSFRKVLRFAYDVSALNKESFYILKIWETEGRLNCFLRIRCISFQQDLVLALISLS